jgi:6,7-dimethyl-8-ribityllumazine synthase
MQLMVHSGVPIINGILTTNNEEQALQRASASHEDKGSEFAYSLLETLSLLETI